MSGTLPSSRELKALISESQRIAYKSGYRWQTVHILFACFVQERSQAREMLENAGVTLDVLLKTVELRRKLEEPHGALQDVLGKTYDLARTTGHTPVGTVHLLTAMCRYREAVAYQVLIEVGVDVGRLRAVGLGRLRRVRRTPTVKKAAPSPLVAVEPVPSIGDAPVGAAPAPPIARSEPTSAQSRSSVLDRSPFSDKPAPPRAVPVEQRPVEPAAPVAASGHEGAPGKMNPAHFILDPDEFPVLAPLARNISELAAMDLLDPAIGRDREVDQLLDVLLKRRSNNPLLVGDPGVGKTAIVEGLAARLASLPVTDPLSGRILVEIPISSLDAGTQFRGAFTERMTGLMAEVANASSKVIVFFDEIHLLMGAGAGDGSLDAGNVLKAALARGEFPCIGATTVMEYSRTIERDPALARRFTTIHVIEPGLGLARDMITGVLPRYADHHGVSYEDGMVRESVDMAHRYLRDRALPDSAVNLLDEAASRVRRAGRSSVSRQDVADVVAESTGIPSEKILITDGERLLEMENHLMSRIVGHGEQIARLCKVIRRNFVGFRSNKPIGSFLILGPTGVGKTETAKVLASYFFQREDALQRFDMSEYCDSSSVNKFIGSPAGYEGHDEMPALTKAIWKRPYQVLLFDEVEKSDPAIWSIFLQILDNGTVEDRRGAQLDFRESIVIMTTNLGAEAFAAGNRRVGFAGMEHTSTHSIQDAKDKMEEKAITLAKKALPPELWGRFDEPLVYMPLESMELRRVAEILVAEASEALERERGVSLEVLAPALDQLFERRSEDDGDSGARGLRRIVEGRVVDLAVHHLLERPEPPGTTLVIDSYEGRLVIVDAKHTPLVHEVDEEKAAAAPDASEGDDAVDTGAQEGLTANKVRGSGAIRSI